MFTFFFTIHNLNMLTILNSINRLPVTTAELQLFYWISSLLAKTPFWTALATQSKAGLGRGSSHCGKLGRVWPHNRIPSTDRYVAWLVGGAWGKGGEIVSIKMYFAFTSVFTKWTSILAPHKGRSESIHYFSPNKYHYTTFSWSTFLHLQVTLFSNTIQLVSLLLLLSTSKALRDPGN